MTWNGIYIVLTTHWVYIVSIEGKYNATQTAVIDQFIKLNNNEFYLKQTKIKLCSVVGKYRLILFDLSQILKECSVNVFYSLIIINYGTIYNLSFWYY